MDRKSDLIREDIDETRAHLSEKLEVLEDQLRGTVESAKSTVEDTIEEVRDGLRKFTPSYQVEEHPLLCLGGAVAAGLLVGRKMNRNQPTSSFSSLRPLSYPAYGSTWGTEPVGRDSDVPATSEYEEAHPSNSPFHLSAGHLGMAGPLGPSLWDKFADTFSDEIEMVKDMAIGALLGTVRDLAKRSVPNLEPQIDQVMDSAMQKFGVSPPEEGAAPKVRTEETRYATNQGNASDNLWKEQHTPGREENLASKVV